MFFFFFNDTATTEIYTVSDTLSLHDALPTSRRAWSTALVSSTASNSETTSNEYSATAGAEDCVQSQGGGQDRQRDSGQGGDRGQSSNPSRTLVERLQRRLVIRIRAVIEVVYAFLARALDELIEHRLAARRQWFVLEVGDGLF